ncbi:MAG: hypothetical protein WBX20_12825 [Terrimicrobiaceae bacterium]
MKQRWQAVYERVMEFDNKLLPSTESERGLECRGPERRRHLLANLRQHPEELRPMNR